MGVVFCDLDSTLADTRHRWGMILRGEDRDKTDWDAYSMACAGDAVIESTKFLLKTMETIHIIVFVSGRSESARALTEDWLDQNDVFYRELILRPAGDLTDNVSFKWEAVNDWMVDATSRYGPLGQVLMIDDFVPVRDRFEAGGIPCVLVTPYGMTGDAT